MLNLVLQIQLQLEPSLALNMRHSHLIVSPPVEAEFAFARSCFILSFGVLVIVYVFASPSTLKSADEFIQIRFFDIRPKICLEISLECVLI